MTAATYIDVFLILDYFPYLLETPDRVATLRRGSLLNGMLHYLFAGNN